MIKTKEQMENEMFSKYKGMHEAFLSYAPEMMHKAIEKAVNCNNQEAQLAALRLLKFKPISLKEEEYGAYCYCEYIIAAGIVMKKANYNSDEYNTIIEKAKELLTIWEELCIIKYMEEES